MSVLVFEPIKPMSVLVFGLRNTRYQTWLGQQFYKNIFKNDFSIFTACFTFVSERVTFRKRSVIRNIAYLDFCDLE